MNNNIYQVLSSEMMDKVIKDHTNKIIAVLCTSRRLGYKRTKKNLYKDSLKDKDSLFIYVEQENFEIENKIPETILPFVAFYYNNEQMHIITNFTESSMLHNLKELKILIKADKLEKMKQSETNSRICETIRPMGETKTKETVEKTDSDSKHVKDNEMIHKRALETQERLKELEQLEKLVKLKKLNALQHLDVNHTDKSKSASSPLSNSASKTSVKSKKNNSDTSF